MKKILLLSLLIILSGCQTTNQVDVESVDSNDSNVITNEENPAEGPKQEQIPATIRNHFKQGNYFLSKSDYNNAIRKFLLVIKLKPDFPQAHYNLGVAYFDTKRPEQAIEEWEKTIQLNPEYTKAYLSLGYAYESLSKNNEAVEFYDKYLQLKPDDPDAKKINQKINLLRGQVTGQGIIGKVIMAAKVDPKTHLPVKPLDIFSDNIKTVYTTADIGDAEKNTNIKVSWYYMGVKNEEILVNSKEKVISGPQNMVFKLNKPKAKPWPLGRYEVRIYVNGKENLSVPFTILKEEEKPDASGKNS